MKNFLIILCVISCNIQAEQYYVSQDNGLDDNDGRNWKTSWKTIQKAVDFVNPGDDIIIRKSLKPYRQVIIKKSGQKGKPITIKGELKHKLPVITGGYLVNKWINLQANNIWTIATTAEPILLIEDEISLAKANSKELNDGQWFWEDDLVYYKPSSSSPYNHSIWRSASAGGIRLMNVSWIVIKDLRMKLGQGPGVFVDNSNHNIIDNVEIKWHRQGIKITNGSDYNQILNSITEENREGIYISFSSSNNLVKSCKVFRNGNLPFWNSGDRGGILIGEQGPNSHNTIDACEVAFNGGPNSDPAVIAYQAPYTRLINNNIHDNYGSGMLLTIWSNDSLAIANTVISNGEKAVLGGYKGISGLSVRRSKRVHVQDNVVLNNYVSPDSRSGLDIGPKGGIDLQGNANDTMENISYKNNRVSGTIGGPDFFISKVPKTPNLIVE